MNWFSLYSLNVGPYGIGSTQIHFSVYCQILYNLKKLNFDVKVVLHYNHKIKGSNEYSI